MKKKTLKLSEILSYRKGKPPKPSPSFSDKRELPYLSPEYLRGKETAALAEADASSVLVNAGDLILLWDGSNAGEFFKAKTGILSSTMVVLNYDCEIIHDYLFFALKYVEPHLRAQVSGSGIPHVDKEILANLEISDLEIREQEEIAAVLTSIDKAVEQTEKMIEKHKRIKRGLLRALLTKGIDEHGAIRSEATHEFKNSPLGRIPKEWELYPVGKVCDIYNNLRKPISALQREKMQGQYPYYGANGIVDFLDEYRVEGKFVLIGEDGDHFLKFDDWEMTQLVEGKFNVNNHAHIIKGTEICLTDWFHHFFCHRDITFYLTRQGAGRFKLNKATLLHLPILIPPTEEQIATVKILGNLSNTLNHQSQQLEKIKVVQTGLMQDLLTGKVRVGSEQTN